MKRFLILCLLFVSLFSSCKKDVIWVPDGYGAVTVEKPNTPYVADKSFKRVSYAYHTSSLATFDTTRLTYLTHLHFAFLSLKDDGTLQTLTNHANFEKLNKLAKENGVKTAFSIQGDSLIFRSVAANAETRKVLVKSLVDFAVKNNLDGIDLDWEYPRSDYGSDITFEIFVKELSVELHSWHKYLSMAVTAGVYAGPVKDGITQGAIEAVDFVNLMAYDGIRVDPGNLNHHSTYAMAEKVLNAWLVDKNLPKEKAVLGLPVYGKTSANASRTYTLLLSDGASPDEDYFTSGATTYYYNGIPTIKAKTSLAMERANGGMFWEYSQDAKGGNSLLKAAYDVSK